MSSIYDEWDQRVCIYCGRSMSPLRYGPSDLECRDCQRFGPQPPDKSFEEKFAEAYGGDEYRKRRTA